MGRWVGGGGGGEVGGEDLGATGEQNDLEQKAKLPFWYGVEKPAGLLLGYGSTQASSDRGGHQRLEIEVQPRQLCLRRRSYL